MISVCAHLGLSGTDEGVYELVLKFASHDVASQDLSFLMPGVLCFPILAGTIPPFLITGRSKMFLH
eukprot:1850257-Amphidinium_carterae.2